jgi:hypothetical protein
VWGKHPPFVDHFPRGINQTSSKLEKGKSMGKSLCSVGTSPLSMGNPENSIQLI